MAFFAELDEDGKAESSPKKSRPSADAVASIPGRGPMSLEDLSPFRRRRHSGTAPHAVAANGPVVGDPVFRSRVTGALGCYPIIASVVSSIDLNTLDSLALTCRQVRCGLLQYRTALQSTTLRCANESLPVNRDETFSLRARTMNYWASPDAGARASGKRAGGSKPGPCARDLVGPCRRCGDIVCRNCTIKPPGDASLRERHRRLCRGCARSPLVALVNPPMDPASSLFLDALRGAFCRCESGGVYLCQPCGRSIRASDREYQRIWRWLEKYGETLGALGTGIGDGNRGAICGREKDCAFGRDLEHEVDSDAEDARDAALLGLQHPAALGDDGPVRGLANGDHGSNGNGNGATPHNPSAALASSRRPSPGPQATAPGYERHEIQGIGGVLKKKLLRMVRVGACVSEYEDEKARRDRMLGREMRGSVRSWCGWCNRVIPGEKDENDHGE